MSDERIAKLEKSVPGLRARVDEADRGHRAELAGLRYAVFASVTAGALLALTATTWRSYRGEDPELEDVTTLWGMAPEGWQGVVAFGLVTILPVDTIAVFVTDLAGRTTHLVLAGLALLTAVATLVLAVTHAARGTGVRDR